MEQSERNSQCLHTQTRDLDGFHVCISCGLVLDNLVFCPYDLKKTFVLNESLSCDQNIEYICEKNTPNHSEDKKYKKISKKKSELYEIYQKNFINFEVYQLCVYLVEKWIDLKIPLEKYHIIYSVYYASRKLGLPISLKEISIFFQISIKQICRLEKILPITNNLNTEDFIFKYCSILSIPYIKAKKCLLTLGNVKKNLDIPDCILAACIIFHTNPELSLSKICSLCNISEYSLNKWTKEMQFFT